MLSDLKYFDVGGYFYPVIEMHLMYVVNVPRTFWLFFMYRVINIFFSIYFSTKL